MSIIEVKIDASRTLDFLGRLPREFKGALDRGIKKSVLLIEAAAKPITPVDTGRLRASIHTRLQPLKGEVSTNVNYAVYVHDGTRYMRARPFMREGLESAEGDIRAVFRNEISQAVR